MKLYKLTRTDCEFEYDQFDALVVSAESEEKAKLVRSEGSRVWPSDEHVKVEHIGSAKSGTKEGIVLGSFIGA